MWWMDETPYPGPPEDADPIQPGTIVSINSGGYLVPYDAASGKPPYGVVGRIDYGPGVPSVTVSTSASEWVKFEMV